MRNRGKRIFSRGALLRTIIDIRFPDPGRFPGLTALGEFEEDIFALFRNERYGGVHTFGEELICRKL